MKYISLLDDCTLCPRNCHVNRNKGETGYCGMTSQVVVARAALHMWEEPCISGEKGSGAVFFSGCAMGCVFCQNHDIARGERGKVITIERLGEIFLELQGKGANNINLVTPSHYVPEIIAALDLAKAKGLGLPIVYNSSGYENKKTLRLLEGYVDIYLPDFKYMDGGISGKYSDCPDYMTYAKETLIEMVRQTGRPIFFEDGIMKSGTIVRHLSLPGYLKDSKDILDYLHDTYKNEIYISIMNQYTPMVTVLEYPQINRKVSKKEYDELLSYALMLGIRNAYTQEDETQDESFIPDFDGEGV